MRNCPSNRSASFLVAVLIAFLFVALPANCDVLTSADLQIQGASFQLITTTAAVQLGSPAQIQTAFGGKTNSDAPVIEGLTAAGDLIGPGISTPVSVTTAPGQAFLVGGLTQEGVYYLQNVRLMKGTQLLQTATPSVCVIQVTNSLQTTVTVRQLTPDELRARGITVDPNNYDVYEYTFSFLVNGQTVQIPYPVIINRTTHEVTPVQTESPYILPTDLAKAPPRWSPPVTIPMDLTPPADFSPPPATTFDPGDQGAPVRPSIHAALVLPTSLAVLHQFFAVALVVTNGAPAGSNVTLDSISATIDAPNQLRIVKSTPAVSFGQPVTITDAKNGATFLVAQGQGEADWTVEGLKPGTYTLNLDVKATFKSPGQRDVPLEATPKASVVVHDARFNITFSHPDTVRKGVGYSTYTFITNTSDVDQTIVLSDELIPACSSGAFTKNVCRVDGTPTSVTVTIPSGATKSVQFKLTSGLTGHIFAAAASVDSANSAINSASFNLDMGVSPTGVPLSPATLILPYYATPPYLSQNLLDAQLGILGIGYGLATAPLNSATAKFPRVITTDVFTRAVDLARAGERMFIGEDRRDSLANMSLDLLGNSVPLQEWDQFRRQETEDAGGDTARGASSALAAELSAAYAGTDGTFNGMADRFAGTTAYRAPYFMALARGAKGTAARPYAVRVVSAATGAALDVPSDQASGWTRKIPYGDLSTLAGTSESGELALIGRSNEALDVMITPAATGMVAVDLLFPASDGKSEIHAVGSFNGTAGRAVAIHVQGGVATSNDVGLASTAVAIAPISLIAARQDLHLDPDGHVVSVLFNRVLPATTADLSADFDTDITLDPKFNTPFTGKRRVAGAALQQDGRIIRLNYDSSLSADAQYLIHTTGLVDPASPATVVPSIETRSSALIIGSVLSGDNSLLPGANITLTTDTGVQYQTADANARFLFEYVPRDPDNGISGNYSLNAVAAGKATTLAGAVRLLHTLQQVNITFLGRGSAQGHVRYDNGDPVPNAAVVVGSTLFSQFRRATTDATGSFNVSDVPVGPLTFSAQDAAGNVAYAANELRIGGGVVVQDVSIFRRPFPGTGTVRGRIVRSDTSAPVPGTHVGVYSQGYGLTDTTTGSDGRFEFTKVPSGFVTVLGENYQVAPQSIAVDFDLKPDAAYDTGDLVLDVKQGAVYVAVTGDVQIESPLQAGTFSPVPGAQVQIDGMPVVTADAAGHYSYASVPQSFAGARIRGFDTSTGRLGTANLPTPLSSTSTNTVPIRLTNASGSGSGTVRVHLLSATGQPVDGYHVFEPGFPTFDAVGKGQGVYEFASINVGRTLSLAATPFGGSDATFGYQIAFASAGVAFPGQISAVTMRLPGQGVVHGRIRQQTQTPGLFIPLAGTLHLGISIWSDSQQSTIPLPLAASTDGTNDAVFNQVPAGQTMTLETFESVGYANAAVRLNFDGDLQTGTLTLTTLSTLRGRVVAPDGYTPVAGAAVRLVDNAQDSGQIPTGLDGSFELRNIAPGSGYTITADWTQNGIYRTAQVGGSTPAQGALIDNVTLILMKQGSVEGTVVDGRGAGIPFARFWLRELSYPGRTFGTPQDPLTTDANGHFRVNNVFAVALRASATDPNNPDLRGDWNGALSNEGEVQTPTITVGGAGTGSLHITVFDPNGNQPVANAEVSLYLGNGLFDFQTTDATGSVTFTGVPVGGGYSASAFSKILGKVGSSPGFSIAKDQTLNQSITLVFTGEVDGTLTDPANNSNGVPGANVTLSGNGYQTRTTTEAGTTVGRFDFKGVREGSIHLEARDPLSIRMARNSGFVDASNPTAHVPLAFEPTSSLVVKAFLPNDSGASSGTLAPLVSVDVAQNAPGGQYLRSSQTNGASFPGMVRGVGFGVTVHELGGQNRAATTVGTFGGSEDTKEIDFVFAASGSVTVTVLQGNPPTPAPNVFVNAYSGGVSANGYTSSAGSVTLTGLPLGTVSIQVSTVGSAPLTGATSVTLSSQSQAAQATVQLGSYNALNGYVEAEAGGPSVGTRLFAVYSGIALETRTDVTGHYGFQGILTSPTGTGVNLTYLGPDDQTIGASQSLTIRNGDGTVTAPNVKLDSTPPRLLSIFPADGSVRVSPDTQLKITFSRAMRNDELNSSYIQLIDVGTTAQVPLSLQSATLQPDKSEVATFSVAVAPPPGQRFPLKSNTLYRLAVSGQIQDSANHLLGVTVGGSFTTSDYSNPQVVKIDPPVNRPLAKQGLRFAISFSKPLDPAPWAQGGNGSMQLVQIDHIGGQAIGAPVPGTTQLDPMTAATLYFGPDVTLAPLSFYRLSITGATDVNGLPVVDANGAPLTVWTQDFFTYSNIAPTVAINTPLFKGIAIADADPLFTGVLYTIPVTVTNADTDFDHVDFFSVDGTGAATLISHSAPKSVDISLPQGLTTFTLKAIAYDFSSNASTPATRTWTVQNVAPLSVASATFAPAAIYAGRPFTETVRVAGGAVDANVSVSVHVNGNTTPAATASAAVSRASFTAAWPDATLPLQLLPTVPANATIVVTTTVSDTRGSVSRTDPLTLTADINPPAIHPLTIQVVSAAPGTTTSFQNNDVYRVHAFTSDAETGVAGVTFTINGQAYPVTTGTFHSDTQLTEFVSPSITVQSHNSDLTVPIVAEAADFAGNKASASSNVTYVGIHDPNAPVVAWLSPLHDAAWPAAQTGFHTTLRVYATSRLPLNATFDVPGLASVTGVVNGGEIDADIILTTPAAGTAFQIVAHVNDGDGGHVIDLSIPIDLVSVGETISAGQTVAVDATHPLLTSDTLAVDGGHLVLHSPVTLKNLIVINGGLVDTVPSTTNNDERINLTVSDHLFVDSASRIDVSHRGYLGGLQANFDSTGSNADTRGMTLGRSVTNGATGGAAASYAGVGADGAYGDTGVTNATYGSITAPADLGSGGAADVANRRGGQGGGAVSIAAGTAKVVIAGSITADGESGAALGGAGSAGSIHVTGKTIVLGVSSAITANGGDDDGADLTARGAGGGRISIEASSLLDIDTSAGARIAAHGGRNVLGESASALDGGAGTIFLRDPGQVNGELLVTALDSRFSSSVHPARATIVSTAMTFDHVTAGPRALVRIDAPITVGTLTNDRSAMTIDPTALVLLPADQPAITASTTPASGSTVIQTTNIAVTYTATSTAGIGVVTSSLTPPITTFADNSPAYPTSRTSSATLTMPATAVAGSTATLTVHAVDRSGRSADTAAKTFTVAANATPTIDSFVVSAPTPLYVGGTINATVTASDDLSVTKVSLTSQLGSGQPSTQTRTPNTPSATYSFQVPVPADATLDGATVTLTAAAEDGFPGRAATTSVKTLAIAHDGNPPTVTITAPASGAVYNVAVGNVIHVVANATDAESGLKSVTASIEGGSTVSMAATGNPNQYGADVPVPVVPGSADVARTITVTAKDVVGNNSNATETVTIRPLVDPTAPIVTWSCPTDGAVLPAGYNTTLSVIAIPGSTGNVVNTVTFSDGTTTVTASANGNSYSAPFTIPTLADGSHLTMTAVVTSIGGGTATIPITLTVIIPDKTISADTTVNDGDATYDHQSVVISGGSTTFIGHHEFRKLIILNGARLIQPPVATFATATIDVKADTLYVACGGSIEASGSGYSALGTYPGAIAAPDAGGGAHLGAGGLGGGSTYGSVYQPQELGAGGAGHGCCQSGANGGGRMLIQAGLLQVDGPIRANGFNSNGGGGAGGSVWIRATKITGGGAIQARAVPTGGTSGGGGGAIAISYTDASSAGAWTAGLNAQGEGGGAAGTILVKGPLSTYGDLTIDNKGTGSGQQTDLPSLGSGLAKAGSSGAVLVTDRMVDIPAYFAGNWVEVRDASGILKGRWTIASIDPANRARVTLAPNGSESINVQPGDVWKGVYRFDSVHAAGVELLHSVDPILIGPGAVDTVIGTTGNGQYTVYSQPIVGDVVEIVGHVMAPEVRATSLTIDSGAILTHASGASLSVTTTGSVSVANGGAIDVSGFGDAPGVTYPGAAGAGGGGGGSHIGQGGLAPGSTFGSVYRPAEAGAGGDPDRGGAPGGGIVRINAPSVVVEGAIRANGAPSTRGGAGGSVWMTTGKITGAGSIEVMGGSSQNGSANAAGSGGGGALTIEYTDSTSTLPALRASGGPGNAPFYIGAAGASYVKGPQSVYGDLTIDSAGLGGGTTELPSLGSGLAQAGTSGATLVTDRAADIPAYFFGNWVEVHDANGALKGKWRIAAVNSKTVMLTPNANETIGILPGDAWAGLYRFDNVTLRTATLKSLDRIEVVNPVTKDASSIAAFNTTAPAILASAIAVSSTASGDFVVGGVGAATDPDQPVKLVVTNARSSVAFSGTANGDGSFSVSVAGLPGDTFTLKATDSNSYAPLTTFTVVSGALVNPITALTVNPSTIAGGSTATGTVTLLHAPAAAATISLTSSSTAAQVPATVIVPANSSSAPFTINTTSVTAATQATITASYAGSTQQATVTVIPSTVTIVSITPAQNMPASDTVVDATLLLSGAAVAPGTITLSSSDPIVATVPATVAVPQGATSVVTQISTHHAGPVTITATFGATVSASLTVSGCATPTATKPSSVALDTIWIDDALPASATLSGPASFVTSQAALGTKSILVPLTGGAHQAAITGAAPLTPGVSDNLVAYVLIDPCSPTRQILFDWTDGTSDYRATWGEDLIDTTLPRVRVSSLPAAGQWTRLEVLASSIGAGGKALTGLTIKVYDGDVYFDAIGTKSAALTSMIAAPAQFPAADVVWFDDQVPAGAQEFIGGTNTSWSPIWTTAQAAMGTRSHVQPVHSGYDQHFFRNASPGFAVQPGDVLYTYVLIDPANPPREILLQWNDGASFEHRAFWGEDIVAGSGNALADFGHEYMGPLPEPGKWARLEIPASVMGLEGHSISGMAFGSYDGQVWFDRSGSLLRTNVALGKTATQSSTNDPSTSADRAVDGNVNGNQGVSPIAITNNEPQPWWQVDLGAVQPIEAIEIWNRTDSGSDRLSDFYVFVSDTPFTSTDIATSAAQPGVSAYHWKANIGLNVLFYTNRTGRYVRVQLTGATFLQLAEVQVFAPPLPAAINLAGGHPATQVSDASAGSPASSAVDCEIEAYYGFAATAGTSANEWWEVDLGSSQPIESIDVRNRFDDDSLALMNFYVLVSDQPFTSHDLTQTLAQSGVYAMYWSTPARPGSSYSFPLNHTGRYVRIQRNGSGSLGLGEVQVWSQGTPLGTAAITSPVQ